MVLRALSSRLPAWEGPDETGAGGFGAGLDAGSGSTQDASGSVDKPARKRRVRKKPVRKKAAAPESENGAEDGAKNGLGAEQAEGDSVGTDADASPPKAAKASRARGARRRSSSKREDEEAPASEREDSARRTDSDDRGDDGSGDDSPGRGDADEGGDSDERGGRKRRRRGSRGGRRRKRGEGDEEDSPEVDAIPGEEDELAGSLSRAEPVEASEDEDKPEGGRKKRTRRKSRRKSSRSEAAEGDEPDAVVGEGTSDDGGSSADAADADGSDGEGGRKKRRRRRSRKKSTGRSGSDGDDEPEGDVDAESEAETEGRTAKKTRRRAKKAGAAVATKTAEEKAAEAEAMRTQTIAVNAVEPEERRVAVYENGRIEDILMTAESQKTLVNDIYRGRVVNLEPAIGAAFIDFGQGRNGFLHTSDVLPIYADDDFQLEDLLTGGHHDEEGDHDADWSEEADALDEEHDDDDEDHEDHDHAEEASDEQSAEGEGVDHVEGAASDEEAGVQGVVADDGDHDDHDHDDHDDHDDDHDDHDGDDGDDGDDHDGGGGGAAPGFAQGIVDDDEEPRGTRSLRSRSRRPASSRVASMDDGDGPKGDGDAKPARKKRKRRSTKKKAVSADADGDAGGGSDSGDGGRKRASSRKRSRKKAASSEGGAEGSAKKASKKKSAKKSERKSKKKASSRRKASKGSAKGGARSRGRSERRPQRERRPIDQLLKVGDQVVVQVTKDAIGDKGPTLTTYISMPGRYLVLMPSMSRTGVSRKIPDDKERKRLKRILASLKTPSDMGVIVRTAGVGRTKADLQRDLDYLLGLWESFGKKLRGSRGPAPLYLESDVATRTLRDLFNRRTKEVLVDDFTVYEQMVNFAEKLMPEHVGRIKRYEGDRPLFQESGLEQEFERIFSRRVDLPSGGSIVLDQAEALVAIDVNSGRTRTDSYDFEDIALKTNMEAVPEIARQIKLRDLGGIIVCDFIDMVRSSSNRQVERSLRDALADDRARSKLGRISQFGLLELTRQRLGPGTHKKVFQACPRCRGTGRVRTIESRSQAILRRLGGAVVQKGFTKIEVRAHPEVVQYLKEDLWDWVRALEHRSEKQIELTPVPDQMEDSVLRYLRADGREVRPGGRRKR